MFPDGRKFVVPSTPSDLGVWRNSLSVLMRSLGVSGRTGGGSPDTGRTPGNAGDQTTLTLTTRHRPIVHVNVGSPSGREARAEKKNVISNANFDWNSVLARRTVRRRRIRPPRAHVRRRIENGNGNTGSRREGNQQG